MSCCQVSLLCYRLIVALCRPKKHTSVGIKRCRLNWSLYFDLLAVRVRFPLLERNYCHYFCLLNLILDEKVWVMSSWKCFWANPCFQNVIYSHKLSKLKHTIMDMKKREPFPSKFLFVLFSWSRFSVFGLHRMEEINLSDVASFLGESTVNVQKLNIIFSSPHVGTEALI